MLSELLNTWEFTLENGRKKILFLVNYTIFFCFSYAPRKSVKDRYTLLKSVHIHSKHMAQYEIRTYFRFMNFHNLTQSTLETYLEYIQRNLPEGTAMKVTKTELQKLPDHLQ